MGFNDNLCKLCIINLAEIINDDTLHGGISNIDDFFTVSYEFTLIFLFHIRYRTTRWNVEYICICV